MRHRCFDKKYITSNIGLAIALPVCRRTGDVTKPGPCQTATTILTAEGVISSQVVEA
ncbi:hypothetical protein DPMN_089019 [Dreissena polymorpha]|uniref:Uncharacterized protein n=1 Tax=Dreissena polymorpha TaxID=45954 RepID=A0A9D4KX02_DREPO|nr:hypothetical protein DPMN_089019 [Dreissena polymorpha]